MSAISSTTLDPQTLLKQLQRTQPSANKAAQRRADFEAAAKAAGADPAKLPELEQQIQQAIQAAQQNSDGSTDPRAAVRDAVDQVLKQNGIDPQKFDAALQAQHAGVHRHHRGARPAQDAAAAPATQFAEVQSAEPDGPARTTAIPPTGGLDMSV